MIKLQGEVPTLGMIELKSIAKGLFVADLMLKKAHVRLLLSAPVGCGKYVIIVTGDEASLIEAMAVGHAFGGDFLMNDFIITNIHPTVVEALAFRRSFAGLDAVGIIESQSLSSIVRCADIAAKASDAELIEITYDLDMGGKGFFTMTGDLANIEASMEAAQTQMRREGTFINSEIIAAPHFDMEEVVKGGKR